jgi:hypothetical protein
MVWTLWGGDKSVVLFCEAPMVACDVQQRSSFFGLHPSRIVKLKHYTYRLPPMLYSCAMLSGGLLRKSYFQELSPGIGHVKT